MTEKYLKERLVLRLLARALIDIRLFSSEGNANACHSLADLFHNVPYQLATVHGEGNEFDEILEWIKMRAEQKNMQNWLHLAIKDCN